MPRRNRFSTGGYVFHVLNRAVGRQTIFANDADYVAFERVLSEAAIQVPMRILSYCILPNHWHLLLWPRGDDDLSDFMHWLTTTHTQRYHSAHESKGTGSIYQGRFKSFPVETDDHFYQVCRYVERNALRANLVSRAEFWRWSSLWQRTNDRADVPLSSWPLPLPSLWTEHVNSIETEAELRAIRNSVARGTPFGNREWELQTAVALGLVKTLRSPGRPRA